MSKANQDTSPAINDNETCIAHIIIPRGNSPAEFDSAESRYYRVLEDPRPETVQEVLERSEQLAEVALEHEQASDCEIEITLYYDDTDTALLAYWVGNTKPPKSKSHKDLGKIGRIYFREGSYFREG